MTRDEYKVASDKTKRAHCAAMVERFGSRLAEVVPHAMPQHMAEDAAALHFEITVTDAIMLICQAVVDKLLYYPTPGSVALVRPS